MSLDVRLEINSVGKILLYLSLGIIIVVEASRRSDSAIRSAELVQVYFYRVELHQALSFNTLYTISDMLDPSSMNPRIYVL